MRAADVDIHVGADTSDAESGFSRVNSMLGTMGGTFLGNMATKGFDMLTGGITDLASSFLMANANAETMRMSLEVATGSASKANEVYGKLQQMAKDTPFEFPELMQSAVMLESMGNNAMDYIGVIGDASAATGKSIDQTTNAFLDAQTGEFERLKEYGIKVVDEGGKTYMEYMKNGQMVKAEVDRNNQEMISSTLAAIWNDKYGGAMEVQAQTFNGQWSTLKDNVNMAMQDMSKPIFEFAKKGIGAANSFFTEFGKLKDQGVGTMDAFAISAQKALTEMFGIHNGMVIMQFVNALINGIQMIIPVVQAVASAIGSAFSAIAGFIGDHTQAIIGAITGIIIALSVIGGAAAFFYILGAAIALVTSPIFLLVAAFALLGAAYATNFLGFADGVNAVAGMIASAFQSIIGVIAQFAGYLATAFSGGWMAGLYQIATDVAGLGDKFTPLKEAFQQLGLFIQMIIPVIYSFKQAFDQLLQGDFSGAWDSFKQGVQGAVAAGRQFLIFLGTLRSQLLGLAQVGIDKLFSKLADMFPAFGDSISLIGSMLSNFIGILKNVSEAFTDLMKGDLEGFFSNLGQAAVDAGQTILAALFVIPSLLVDAFHAIDWGGVWDGLTSAASAAWDAIKSTFAALVASLSASGIGQAIMGALSSALSGATGLIGGWISSISGAIMDGLSAAGDWVMSSFQAAWDAITQLNWGDYINPLEWAEWIGGKIADIASWVWGKISGFFPSASVIGGAIADFASWVWTKISSFFPAASVLAGAIADFGSWIWTKIQAFFPQASIIAGGIQDIATWVWTKISGFFPSGSVISGAIADFGSWIWTKIQAFFPQASIIAGGINDIATWVWTKISGFFPSANVVSGAISDVGNWIWTKISSYFPTASIIAGGINDIATWVWGKISGFFPSSSMISGSIGDLGSWFYKMIGSPSVSIPAFPGWSTIAKWIFGGDDDSKGGDSSGGKTSTTSTGGSGGIPTIASTMDHTSELLLQALTKYYQSKPGNGNLPGQGNGNMPGDNTSGPQPTPYIPPPTFPPTSPGKGDSFASQATVFRLQAQDDASPVINQVKAALIGIPAEKRSQILQNGGEAVQSTSQNIRTALDNIPQSKMTAISQAGGEAVQSSSTAIRSALDAIPPSKMTSISQAGGEAVQGTSSAIRTALDAIPPSKMTALSALGGAQVQEVTQGIKQNINDIPEKKDTKVDFIDNLMTIAMAQAVKISLDNIPTSHLTSITEAGGATVTGSSTTATNAIRNIPTSHFTSITESGASTVTGNSNTATNAIRNIPTSHFTSITESGGSGVASVAYAAAAAINSIPTSKFVSFGSSGADSIISAANAAAAAVAAIPSSKSVSISAYATGGYTQGSVVSLAEEGRELLRFPWGELALANTRGLYQVPEGTFVYTNPETENIIGKLDNIEHYASGGWVGGPAPHLDEYRSSGSKDIYLVTTPDLFHDIADAVDTVKVLTNASEIATIFEK